MNIVIGPLETFYLAGSILILTIVLIAYPTLKDETNNEK